MLLLIHHVLLKFLGRRFFLPFFCLFSVRLAEQMMPRRAGDVESMYADPSLAQKVLGWAAKRNLKDMCDDTWRWQNAHPNGYLEA